MSLFGMLPLRYLVMILGLSHGVHACDQNLTDVTGFITSPNYPEDYDNNLDCTYIITSSAGQPISLVFLDFQLETQTECNNDYVIIFDGFGEERKSLGKYCEREIPDPILALSGTLHLIFHTDRNKNYRGFQAEYSTNPNPDCVEVIEARTGSIKSPNFPSNYPNNVVCLFLIIAPNRLPIGLTFSKFDLEDTRDCKHDYVRIKDGIGADAGDVGDAMCGTTLPLSLFTKTGKMFIIFVSGERTTKSGFSAVFQEENIVACNGVLNASSGIVLSPNYPKDYKNEQHCEYTIQSTNNQQINLTFLDFQLEFEDDCHYDYVEVFDDNIKVEKFCGTSIPVLKDLLSNNIRMVFSSDESEVSRGFYATFEEKRPDYATGSSSLSTLTSTMTTDLSLSTLTSTNRKDLPQSTLHVITTDTTGYIIITDINTADSMSSSTDIKTTDINTADSMSSSTAVPAVVGTLVGIVAVTISVVVIVFILKRRKIPKHLLQMHDCIYTTQQSTSNNTEYSKADDMNEADQQLSQNFTPEFQYSTAENTDLTTYYSSVKAKKTGYDGDYELAKPINSSPYSMSYSKCFDEAENDYVDQGDAYNVLNIHPAKHTYSETTSIYDRTVDSVYDMTTKNTTEEVNDLGTYDHTTNISD